MASQKIGNMVVATGEYIDREGKSKKNYENIGSLMKGDYGFFAILNRTFNPAGVPNPKMERGVFVSVFDKAPRGVSQEGQQSPPPSEPSASSTDFDDDIPF